MKTVPLLPMLQHRANQAEAQLAYETNVPRWVVENRMLLAELEHHDPARWQEFRLAIAERCAETMSNG